MNVWVSIQLLFFTQWIHLNNQTYLKVADNFSVELRLKLKYGSGSFLWGTNSVKLPEKTCPPSFHLADSLDYSSRTSPRRSPVNQQLSSVRIRAIAQLLARQLQAALELYICDSSLLAGLKSPIPLKLTLSKQRVLYVSAIALQLSQVLKLPALDIARALARCCNTDEQYFTVQVIPPGWIYLEITESYLAAWLQHLIQVPLELKGEGDKGDKGDNFKSQYAHARCCSLLQMAHREELITLEPTNSSTISALWMTVTPLPIPWLDSEQKLCLSHPSEWGLIFQLVAILDNLYCSYPSRQPPNWHKAALNLSQAFQTFYTQCRIWGEVKSQNLPSAQARLGLVLITQSVLRLLLQDKLGIVAPSEV